MSPLQIAAYKNQKKAPLLAKMSANDPKRTSSKFTARAKVRPDFSDCDVPCQLVQLLWNFVRPFFINCCAAVIGATPATPYGVVQAGEGRSA